MPTIYSFILGSRHASRAIRLHEGEEGSIILHYFKSQQHGLQLSEGLSSLRQEHIQIITPPFPTPSPRLPSGSVGLTPTISYADDASPRHLAYRLAGDLPRYQQSPEYRYRRHHRHRLPRSRFHSTPTREMLTSSTFRLFHSSAEYR